MGMSLDLTDVERRMLVHGVNEWGGPAALTDALAVALGFESSEECHQRRRVLSEAVRGGRPLEVREWTQALVTTEFVFASGPPRMPERTGRDQRDEARSPR